MTTQEGSNVDVCAIKGNFDDAQTGVKNIFSDKELEKVMNDAGFQFSSANSINIGRLVPEIIEKLQANDKLFSSANSINWGRLLPQIVYYISAYCDLVNKGTIKFGDKVNVVVPTGNFGNILASYYAMLMGLPINKFICASNSNNVLTDFTQAFTIRADISIQQCHLLWIFLFQATLKDCFTFFRTATTKRLNLI